VYFYFYFNRIMFIYLFEIKMTSFHLKWGGLANQFLNIETSILLVLATLSPINVLIGLGHAMVYLESRKRLLFIWNQNDFVSFEMGWANQFLNIESSILLVFAALILIDVMMGLSQNMVCSDLRKRMRFPQSRLFLYNSQQAIATMVTPR
jgi:hypothetical protein